MKKEELVGLIKVIIREEIEKSLPQVLMEILAEKIVSAEKPESPAPRLAPANYRKPQVALEAPLRSEVRAPRLFSSNPVLNKVLNETQGGLPTENEIQQASAFDVIENLPQEVLNENAAMANVAKALTRDYRSILKTVDAKAKANYRPR